MTDYILDTMDRLQAEYGYDDTDALELAILLYFLGKLSMEG